MVVCVGRGEQGGEGGRRVISLPCWVCETTRVNCNTLFTEQVCVCVGVWVCVCVCGGGCACGGVCGERGAGGRGGKEGDQSPVLGARDSSGQLQHSLH